MIAFAVSSRQMASCGCDVTRGRHTWHLGCLSLQVFGFDESDERFVVRTVVLVRDGGGVVHGRPGLLPISAGTNTGGGGTAGR